MMQHDAFPLWLKLSITLFMCVFISVYWVIRGPANLLWFSDIALFAIVLSLWSEKSLPASMLAVGVLLFELGWVVDFLARLIFGHHIYGIGSTGYMFSDALPLVIQVLSLLLHIIVPGMLIYILYKLGYDRRGLIGQTLLAWVLVHFCYFFTDPERNVNWAFGVDGQQTWFSPHVYLIVGLSVLTLVVYVPSHFILKRLFPVKRI